jgi:hypothetical protein
MIRTDDFVFADRIGAGHTGPIAVGVNTSIASAQISARTGEGSRLNLLSPAIII